MRKLIFFLLTIGSIALAIYGLYKPKTEYKDIQLSSSHYSYSTKKTVDDYNMKGYAYISSEDIVFKYQIIHFVVLLEKTSVDKYDDFEIKNLTLISGEKEFNIDLNKVSYKVLNYDNTNVLGASYNIYLNNKKEIDKANLEFVDEATKTTIPLLNSDYYGSVIKYENKSEGIKYFALSTLLAILDIVYYLALIIMYKFEKNKIKLFSFLLYLVWIIIYVFLLINMLTYYVSGSFYTTFVSQSANIVYITKIILINLFKATPKFAANILLYLFMVITYIALFKINKHANNSIISPGSDPVEKALKKIKLGTTKAEVEELLDKWPYKEISDSEIVVKKNTTYYRGINNRKKVSERHEVLTFKLAEKGNEIKVTDIIRTKDK